MSGKIEISRELAERLLNFTCNEEYDELRALIAKSDDAEKVNNRQMGLMQFVDKHAAPVVERQPVSADIVHDKAYRNGMMAGFSFGIRGDEDGYAKAVERYDAEIHAAKAEQPAPVAVVLPERKHPRPEGDNTPPSTYNANLGWNACLDKVKELNQ